MSVTKTDSTYVCYKCGAPGLKTDSNSNVVRKKHSVAPGVTIRKKSKPSRNKPCECGSGTKYKNCCGQPKPAKPHRAAYQGFSGQYTESQLVAQLAFVRQWGFQPNPAQLMTFMDGDADEIKSMVVRALRGLEERVGADNSAWIFAVLKLGRLITPLNQGMVEDESKKEWADALAAFREQHDQADHAG